MLRFGRNRNSWRCSFFFTNKSLESMSFGTTRRARRLVWRTAAILCTDLKDDKSSFELGWSQRALKWGLGWNWGAARRRNYALIKRYSNVRTLSRLTSLTQQDPVSSCCQAQQTPLYIPSLKPETRYKEKKKQAQKMGTQMKSRHHVLAIKAVLPLK